MNTRKWVVIGTTVLAAIVIIAAILVSKWPFTEARVQHMLESRTGRTVQIAAFQKTYFPPGFVAGGIRFLGHKHPDSKPPIEIGKLVVKGSWPRLTTFSHAIPQVDLYKLRLRIPPRNGGASEEDHDLINPQQSAGATVAIGSLVVHEAILEFVRSDSAAAQGKSEPYQVEVKELILSDLASKESLGFEAVVENSLPRGEVHAQGRFGPWNSAEPASTPLRGSFTFQNAKLSDIPGISGTLQAKGKMWGTLGQEEAEGDAVVPDFRVLHSVHTEDIRTVFRASVDATKGDVILHQIDSTFGKTTVHAKGTISGEGRKTGKEAVLQAWVNDGRVDDLEKMFTHDKTPPLTGHINLQTSIVLPSGKAKFLERLQMTGNFQTTSGRFTNISTQGMLNRLKESAHGETKKQQDTDRETVSSRMQSHIVVKNGVAHVEHLMLEAPDTVARLDGTLNLLSKDVNLSGTLKTDGKLSDTQSGFKAFAVKLITPFLKKQHTTVVPFEIRGTLGNLSTRLDLDGKRKL